MVAIRVPTPKLRLRRMRSCTMGSRLVNSRTMKPTSAAAEISRRHANPVGFEPVGFLPLVQNQLHGAEPDGHQAEAEVVDGASEILWRR